MKRVLGAGIIALTIVLATAPAAGAAPTPTEKKLQKQVATLQKQVKTLQKQSKDNELLAEAALVVAFCNTALTADALQGTWAVIDEIAQATQAKTYFGAQNAVNDSGVCNALRVVRSQRVPPTTSGFATILDLLRGTSVRIPAAVRLP
jgi:hypothetical protein